MKENVQRFGRFLSGMVMPNISAFIAWGILTALVIPTGWWPNEALATMVGPIITYLLPLLIAYTGGKIVHGTRGGVVGATATMGVIVGSGGVMFMGAMIMGPLGGWLMKKIDEAFEEKIPAGFEMLVNNFDAGILAFILLVFAYYGVSPVVTGLTNILGSGVEGLVASNLLPLTSILVEPAKVLFLNNAINHGVFTPLGLAQVTETGKSLLFLVEANPGPGLGLLLAYSVAGTGNAKASAPGAIIIHFFGGIHEIYFPYVLMNPILIIGMIAGGATGVLVNTIFNSGLVAAASPGSIFAVLAMTEKASYLGVILSVTLSAAVSFVVNVLLLRFTNSGEGNLDEATSEMKSRKAESKGQVTAPKALNVKKIVFACDAGMGSSAMGATALTKKLNARGYNIKVTHSAIEDVKQDIDVVVTQENLAPRVREALPNAKVFTIKNFMGGSEYEAIIDEIEKL
jgi:PTS system mannitol-specific IIC component